MNNPDSIRDDISYMRQLAESGRKGPILGGTFLMAAGLVFGLTCVVQWAATIGFLPIAGWSLLYLWLAAFIVFAAVWFILFFRQRARGGLSTGGTNALFGTIWSACAIGITVTVVINTIVGRIAGSPAVFDLNVSLPFVFYGIAWGVSAVMARRAWMYFAALAAMLFALVLAALTGSPHEILAMGVALFLALSVPGYKLMTEEARG